jgi:hypothetical protein
MNYNDLISRVSKDDMIEWSSWIMKGFENSIIAQNAIISQSGFIEFDQRTICNIIHDTVCTEAIKKYSLSENVVAKYFEQLKLFGILFKNECFIRINKLNKDYTICGNTNQKRAFFHQEPLLEISDEIPRLILGYIFNESNTKIISMHLIYWNVSALWDYNILEDNIIYQKRIQFAFEKDVKDSNIGNRAKAIKQNIQINKIS